MRAFLLAKKYRRGDHVHLIGDHPWSGRRRLVLGEEHVGLTDRVMYRVLLAHEDRAYPFHVCFADGEQLLPDGEERIEDL
jgi:hypothetical protein